MSNQPDITWTTNNPNESYGYWIYPIGTYFDPVPANYIYAKQTQPGFWASVYIGETGDLSERPLAEHHKESCILAHGATHIHVHRSSPSAHERQIEESNLIEKWHPVCNG